MNSTDTTLGHLLRRHADYVALLRSRRLTADEETTLREIENEIEAIAPEGE